MSSVEAVAAESLSAGDVLWSERRQAELGSIIEAEPVDGGDRVRIHWRHVVNAHQNSVSSQTVARDAMIPIVCVS